MGPSLSLLFGLFFVLQGFSGSLATTDYDLCNWLGGYYVSYDQCVASLRPDPRSRTASYPELAVISVNLTIAKATSVQSKFGALAKDGRDPKTKPLLINCFDMLSRNVTSLRPAADDAAAKNYARAAAAVFKFSSVPGACEDQFQAKTGVNSPLAKEDSALMDLALVANAINDFLSNHHK